MGWSRGLRLPLPFSWTYRNHSRFAAALLRLSFTTACSASASPVAAARATLLVRPADLAPGMAARLPRRAIPAASAAQAPGTPGGPRPAATRAAPTAREPGTG
eukprot:CAMPEP_0179012468 /NCGR_PEP_ID=MMETSP0796-20121207/1216_1 /TAXON_ID=73915 /ORGANISM="Pyrodinium bahamense, Strain pbaha01" /LENGTH=102 /DNA_ID=CAMNT_0020707921 /DNA_START=443 /DNA_END=747 /DNA_ORIENTATION=+